MVASQNYFFKREFNLRLKIMIVMTTLVERIQEALNAKKMSWSKAAVSIGLSPQAPAKWKKGQIGKETLDNLATLLEVDVGWLLSGQNDAKQAPSGESSFSNVSFNDLQLRKIPVLDFVQAGIFNATNYDGIIPLSYTFTDYNGSNPEAIFSVVVTGKSMEPDFVAGDKLIIDAALSAKPGCFVIAQNGAHEATFKKFRVTGYDEHGRETFELVPLNPDYPTLSSKDHDITIIGVMVRHMRDYKY